MTADWLTDLRAAYGALTAYEPQWPIAPKARPQRDVGDLSEGDVVLAAATGHRFCRVCGEGIHIGQPVVSHRPVESSLVRDHYHPSCIPEGAF